MHSRSMTWGAWRRRVLASSSALSIGALIALSGCFSAPRSLDVTPMELPAPERRPALPLPQPLDLRPVKWQVVIVDGEPRFALDAQQYENLSHNIAEMTRWARESMWHLRYMSEDGK